MPSSRQQCTDSDASEVEGERRAPGEESGMPPEAAVSTDSQRRATGNEAPQAGHQLFLPQQPRENNKVMDSRRLVNILEDAISIAAALDGNEDTSTRGQQEQGKQ